MHQTYLQHRERQTLWQDDVVRRVKAAYAGLVRQIDDHVGRLVDHGAYPGDHWLGNLDGGAYG